MTLPSQLPIPKLRLLGGLLDEAERKRRSASSPIISSWKPIPDLPDGRVHPQRDATEHRADELYFGGQAGGSKTCWLVGNALTRHRRSLILRREASLLSEVIAQLKEFAPLGSRWRSIGNGGIMNTSDRRFIECKGVPHEDDRENFKGQPHDAKMYDEIGDFTETQYRFINGWNRTTVPNQRCRVLCAGNPPTRGSGEWVINRWRPWLDPSAGKRALPGELRWYSTVDGKEEEFPDGTPFKWKEYDITPLSRTFIPSKLSDNPYLMGTNYASTLANLPEGLRRAYLDGDFTVCLLDDIWQTIPTSWIKAAMDRWKPDGGKGVPITKAGADVAYGGEDNTVLAKRHANWIAPFDSWQGEVTDSGKKAANLIIPKLKGYKGEINFDVNGWGAACGEFLKENNYKANPVNFGAGAANQMDRRNVLAFSNMRALCYWRLRDLLDPEFGDCLAIPPDPDLLAELAVMRYSYRSGRIFIVSKDEIKAQLGRSPDKADALALACYETPRIPFHFQIL